MTYLLIPLNEDDDPVEVDVKDEKERKKLDLAMDTDGVISFRQKKYFVDGAIEENVD